MSSRRSLALAFALVATTISAEAVAQSNDPEPAPSAVPSPQPPAQAQAQAQEAMERGVEAARRGDFEAALAAYHKAAELVPEANLPHRYAAEVLVELHRYDDAIGSYETYLRIRPNVQDAATVKQRIDEIRSKYIEGVVDVECAPDGAAVTVDDAPGPAGTTPLRGLRLRAGAHRITVRADGYRDGTWPAQVAAGSTRVVQCSLDRVASALSPLGPLIPGPKPAEPPPKKSNSILGAWWFWTGIGVLAAGAGVTAIALSSHGSDAPRTDGGTLKFP